MGLTKRGKNYYVSFPVIDDGKTLKHAPFGSRSLPGVKVKRWLAGRYKEQAERLEAIKRTELESGIAKTEAGAGPMPLKALTEAYLALPRIKEQADFERKQTWVTKRFLPFFGEGKLIDAITQEEVDAYYQKRRKEVAVATANRELACIKHIVSWGCGTARKLPLARPYLERNPARGVWKENEDNVRDVIAEPGEFEALQAASPPWLRPINQVAYETGMRQGEIRKLTWEQVDEKESFLKLRGKDTKTKEGRLVPLSPALATVLAQLRKIRGIKKEVFLRDGEAIPKKTISENFGKSRKRAGARGFPVP
jgi:integrase